MAVYGTMHSPPTCMAGTLVEISVSAQNLRQKDVLSKSDPMCVLYMKETGQDKFLKVGYTELIKNTNSPQWIKNFDLEYRFEERQILQFRIYDWDHKGKSTKHQDPLGFVEISLGEIMGNMGSKCMKSIKEGTGHLNIIGEEVSSSREIVTMNFIGCDLDKKDIVGKSDPFLVFYHSHQNNVYTAVHKTEVIKDTLNPLWKTIVIPAKTLCAGDYNRDIRIECYDYDFDGGHDFIGECYTNVRSLLESECDIVFELINQKKKAGKQPYNNSGVLICKGASTYVEPSFLDYIRGGTQVHFTVAVDFTKSNGNPRNPDSLHFMHPGSDNQYSLAIKAVGRIIQDYDYDKLFPALGFGGRIPPNGELSNEFFLNGSTDNPYCRGVQGILEAYKQSLASVGLYGPTKFSPVINHVSRFASSYTAGKNYFVLLIITDGILKDLLETKKALVKASHLPMSVIIVGVGNADFSNMKILDGDDKRLSVEGKYAVRDIVQFVELRKYLSHSGEGAMNSSHISQALLARDVLAEIPKQFESWMKYHNILPMEPVVHMPHGMH